MTITTALLADHPEHLTLIARWIYEEWSIHTPGSTVESVTHRLRSHLRRTEVPLMVIALTGTTCVGCASLRETDLPSRPDLSPWLASVYVTEEARRQGVGSALVRAVEEHAASLGVQDLFLFTPDRQDFYTTLGWHFYSNDTHHGRPVTVMVQHLQNHHDRA